MREIDKKLFRVRDRKKLFGERDERKKLFRVRGRERRKKLKEGRFN